MANDRVLEGKPSDAAATERRNILLLGQASHGKSTTLQALAVVLAQADACVTEPLPWRWDVPNDAQPKLQVPASQLLHVSEGIGYNFIDIHDRADHLRYGLSGTLRIDGAILVISAADGPGPETRDHLRLAEALRIPRIAVWHNKCDLVDDPDLLELIEMEIRELLERYGFDGEATTITRGSALLAVERGGEWLAGVEALFAAAAGSVRAERKPGTELRLQVHEVWQIEALGVLVTGHVARGVVRAGDQVEVCGLNAWRNDNSRPSVAGLHKWQAQGRNPQYRDRDWQLQDFSSPEAGAGDKVTAVLSGIRREDMDAGQVLCTPGSARDYRLIEIDVHQLSSDALGFPAPSLDTRRIFLRFAASARALAALVMEPDSMPGPGKSGRVRALLMDSLVLDEGTYFALTYGGWNIGSGIVAKLIE